MVYVEQKNYDPERPKNSHLALLGAGVWDLWRLCQKLGLDLRIDSVTGIEIRTTTKVLLRSGPLRWIGCDSVHQMLEELKLKREELEIKELKK